MLEIKNTQVWGLERALIASGNPMTVGEINTLPTDPGQTATIEILNRGERLGRSPIGSAHDHFLLGIHVQFDIKYPQYWTIEAERYHNFEIISSQSKMHRLTAMMRDSKEFSGMFNKYVDDEAIALVKRYCEMYEKEGNTPEQKYAFFMRALSNCPMGMEMWMTCDLTYLQLKTVVAQRRHHKLKEDWAPFCEWALNLPHFKELTGLS